MTVRLRFTLLLGLVLLGFVGALLTLQWLDRRESTEAQVLLHRTRDQQLDHWLAVTSRSLQAFTAEGAKLAANRFATSPGPLNSIEAPAAEEAGITGYWIVRANGTVVQLNATYSLLQPPVAPERIALWNREPPLPRFFSESDSGLLELSVEPIPAAESGAPWGWFIAARRWDENHLQLLANLTEGRVTLDLHPAVVPAGPTVHTRLLPDAQGRPLRSLQVSYPPPLAAPARWFGATGTTLFLGFGLLLISGLGLALRRWVLRPLRLIETSLAQDQPAPVQPLLDGRDEFAGTARLLQASFAQRDALKREIEERRRIAAALLVAEAELRRTLEERTRLGRDLHDGVIQALYATGMGLAGIRALLPPEEKEAAERLNQARATLNEIIRDVRNFITGIEPEALKQQTFTQAVGVLLEFMKNISPTATEAEIDETLAAQLTLGQRANALHIMREAVSNALRHGAAEHIRVALSRTPGGDAALDITDDGVGFSPGAGGTNRGRGLENLAQRATELGATFTLASEPGRGTHLRFVFNLPRPS